MQVEELTYDLVFEWSKKNFSSFSNTLQKSVKGFAVLSAGVATAQGLAFAFAKSIADSNDQLAKLSTRLNIASQDYEKLAFGANDSGASTEDLTTSLRALRKAQEDVLLGKGDIMAFSELGINPSQFEDTNEMFLALSDSISQIDSRSKKLNLLDRIGVSENLLQLLESGSDNIRNTGEELALLGGIKTKEQLAVAGEFQAVFLRTQKIVGGLGNLVGTELTKKYNKALKTINKFFEKNAKSITKAFNKFFDVLHSVSKTIVSIFERVINLIIDITNLMGGFENAVIAVGVAFTILKRKMLLAFAVPLIIATALFAIVEDIVGLFSGKESAIGDFLGIKPETIQSIKDYFSTLRGSYSAFKSDIQKEGIGTAIMNDFKKFGGEMSALFDGLLKLLSSFATAIKDQITEAFSNFNPLQGIESTINSLNPFNSTTQAQAVTTNSNNANVTINVSGADGSSDVIDQLENYFKSGYTSLFGTE